MSSSNASNIVDMPMRNKSDNDYSNTTPININESSTYWDGQSQYSRYMMSGRGNGYKRILFEPNEGDDMSNNDILQAYMDKVDQDQRDLKNEMREREARLNQNIKDSEKRMDDRLDRIEKMILEQNKNYDEKIEKLSNKFDKTVSDIKSNKLQILALVIASILSVAGIAIAAMQIIQGIISIIQ